MIFLLLFFVICVLYGIWTWRLRYYRGPDDPPMMRGAYPIIGHAYMFLGDNIKLWNTLGKMSEEATQQGGVVRALLGTNIHYIVTDPDDYLLAANECMQKHFMYDFAKDWLGDGLITSSGEIWKRHRRMLTPTFGNHVITGYLGVFNDQARKLVSELAVEAGKGPRDISTYFRRCGIETLCLTAFGMMPEEESKFNETYMKAADQILTLYTQRFQNLWLQSDEIYKLSGMKKKELDLIKVVTNMCDLVIKRKKTAMNEIAADAWDPEKPQKGRYKTFLDLLLSPSTEEVLTDKEIRQEVDTAILVGFDTTAWVAIFVLLHIGSYPHIQERIYNEIKEVFDDSDRDVTKEDFSQLIYLDAVIKETLRFYTTGPVNMRYVDKDVKLKNYTMKAGTNCALLAYGVLRHHCWGPDRLEFRPERWLEPNGVPEYAFVAFSSGKRTCIGKHYAMTSLKVTIAHIMRKYKVKADISKTVFKINFLIKPASGHLIELEERK